MVINKSTFPFPSYIFDLSDEDIKKLHYNKIHNIEEYYGKRLNGTKYIHEAHVHHDLMSWQFMFPYGSTLIKHIHFGSEYDKEEEEYWFDGYSQVEWCLSGGVDKQIFIHGDWINLFIADIYGGIVVRINKRTYNISFYAIGEDDGSWFLTNSLWITNLNYWKGLIMSEISELYIPDFNHQLVIEKIWNGDLTNIEQCLK